MDDGLSERMAAMLPPDAVLLGRAPGRANLMGEHTDYNDGFVLPVALDLRTDVGGRPTADKIRLRSVDANEEAVIDPSDGSGPRQGWGRYCTAIVLALLEDGVRIRAVDGVIASSVPAGTGISSSAALLVAVAIALLEEPIEARRLALACQRAENAHVGIRSGIMDPLASIAARAGSAMLLDCRTLTHTDVPVPDGVELLIIDSGQRRRLSDGEYNRRRDECEEAARRIGVRSLRDVSEVRPTWDLPPTLAARARHVTSENARTVATADALRRDDRSLLGELFAASHRSLAVDFAVSTPALDALVELATNTDGIIGSRLTGAGFGGSTVSLIDAHLPDADIASLIRRYEERTGNSARAWRSGAAGGAFQLLAT